MAKKKKTAPKKTKKAAKPKKKAVKTAAKAKAAPKKKKKAKKPAEPVVEGILLGKVEDYFAKIGVVALTLVAPLNVGDKIRVKGHTTDFTQTAESMQIEHASVTQANKGDSIGIKVQDRVRRHDKVYKVD